MGKAVPLRAWTSPYGCRSFRLPECIDGGHMKVVRATHRENPSSRSHYHTCGRADGRSDMTELTGAFRDYANTLKKKECTIYEAQCIYLLLEANSHC
jgi:hypothetical protein